VIIDSSILVAIVKDEPEAPVFEQIMQNSDQALRMSAANWFEAAIVADGMRIAELSLRFDRIVERASLEIVAVTPEHATIARDAYRAFGKGSGHKAQLNYGDCFAYALAVQTGEPLLFKGNDFNHTDVAVA
jgi:ribonuclease VapC